MIGFLARLAEEFKAGMLLNFVHGDRTHLFGHHSSQPFMQRHAKRADALAAQADGGGQNQIGAIRFQQVSGADVRMEAPGDQSDHVHQRFRGLAPFLRKRAELFQGEDMIERGCF